VAIVDLIGSAAIVGRQLVAAMPLARLVAARRLIAIGLVALGGVALVVVVVAALVVAIVVVTALVVVALLLVPAEATMDNATAAVRNFFMALVSLPGRRRSGGPFRTAWLCAAPLEPRLNASHGQGSSERHPVTAIA
jgi:hypothetical protein